MTTNFIDAATLAGTRLTTDGYMIADAVVARTGIQQYQGSELGLVDRGVVRVYRPDDEVSDPESVKTYSHAPVTMGHPDQPVTSENWSDLAKGEVGEDAGWEDGRLRLPLIVKDADAIAEIKAGTRDLSAGYSCDLDWTAGRTDDGEEYDAIQRNIRINHVAIVPRGRAGVARIGDAEPWGIAPITTSTKGDEMPDALKTVVLGDQAVQVSAADAATIDAFKAAQAKALTDAATAHAAEIKAKDAEITTLKSQVEDGKKALADNEITDEKLNAAIADRAHVFDMAKKMGVEEKDMDKRSAKEIRKMAVEKKVGDAATNFDDAQIAVSFDTLVASLGDQKTDPLKDGLPKPKIGDAEALNDAYVAQAAALSDGWKQPLTAKEAS